MENLAKKINNMKIECNHFEESQFGFYCKSKHNYAREKFGGNFIDALEKRSELKTSEIKMCRCRYGGNPKCAYKLF